MLREATRRDIPAVAALWHEMMEFHQRVDPRFHFRRDIQKELERHLWQTIRSRDAALFVAEDGDSLVGYIAGEIHHRRPIYPAGTYGFISDLCVTAARRREGIGSRLVAVLLDWFRSRGITTVELLVAVANPVSTGFWRAMGFGEYLQLLRKELPLEEGE